MKRLIIYCLLLGCVATALAVPTDEERRAAIRALFDRTDAVKASELCDSMAALRTNRPIWHENDIVIGTDPLLADNALMNFGDDSWFLNLSYLSNRRALVGENCTVNKLITVVGVGSWNADMSNLTDEDIGNYAQFNRVVSAGVTADPVVAIRDMANYYAAGTRAGFCITASSGSTGLTLAAIKVYSIGFYRDGSLVGTKDVSEGTDVEGVQLHHGGKHHHSCHHQCRRDAVRRGRLRGQRHQQPQLPHRRRPGDVCHRDALGVPGRGSHHCRQHGQDGGLPPPAGHNTRRQDVPLQRGCRRLADRQDLLQRQ